MPGRPPRKIPNPSRRSDGRTHDRARAIPGAGGSARGALWDGKFDLDQCALVVEQVNSSLTIGHVLHDRSRNSVFDSTSPPSCTPRLFGAFSFICRGRIARTSCTSAGDREDLAGWPVPPALRAMGSAIVPPGPTLVAETDFSAARHRRPCSHRCFFGFFWQRQGICHDACASSVSIEATSVRSDPGAPRRRSTERSAASCTDSRTMSAQRRTDLRRPSNVASVDDSRVNPEFSERVCTPSGQPDRDSATVSNRCNVIPFLVFLPGQQGLGQAHPVGASQRDNLVLEIVFGMVQASGVALA